MKIVHKNVSKCTAGILLFKLQIHRMARKLHRKKKSCETYTRIIMEGR